MLVMLAREIQAHNNHYRNICMCVQFSARFLNIHPYVFDMGVDIVWSKLFIHFSFYTIIKVIAKIIAKKKSH